jgi:Transposase DDE domain
MDIVRLFVDCDQFCQETLPNLNTRRPRLSDGKRHRQRESGLTMSEVMTIVICHNRRIESNKVFRGLARRGKTSVGWFYGFKVHLVINDSGELLGVMITAGNVDMTKRIRPWVDFKLSIDNLTDKRYFEWQNYFESHVTPGAEARARIHGTPGYPVGVSAGLTFRLGAKD